MPTIQYLETLSPGQIAGLMQQKKVTGQTAAFEFICLFVRSKFTDAFSNDKKDN